MSSRTLAALLAAAAVAVSGPAAAADDFNLARHLLQSGELAPEDVTYWTVAARQYDDWVEWKKIVERDTKRLAESTQRAAELDRQAEEIALIMKGRELDRLARERASDSIRQVMRDVMGITFEGDPPVIDPKATASSGPLQDYLRKIERARARLNAKAQGVGAGLKTTQALDRWVQVVVDSTGEVIVNDPVDVAHARLEDLARRQAELEARLKGELDPAELGAIVDELISLEREVDRTLSQIAGYVFRLRSPLRNVCFPPPVKGKPVAVFNCQYWAQGVPIVLNTGDKIIIDRIRLDIDFRERHDEASVGYYWHYASQPSPSEPQSNPGGELRHGPDGALSLVIPWTDEDGDERETLYSLTLATDRASGFFPPISDEGVHHLVFRRDPENYIPWSDYEAAAKGKPPERRTPAPPPAPGPSRAAAPEPREGEDGWLAPLTTPPAPAPEPQEGEDGWLAPLTTPPAPAPEPQEGEDGWLAPLTTPPAPAEGEDGYLAPLTPP